MNSPNFFYQTDLLADLKNFSPANFLSLMVNFIGSHDHATYIFNVSHNQQVHVRGGSIISGRGGAVCYVLVLANQYSVLLYHWLFT